MRINDRTPFRDASWIGKKYKLKANKRKRGESGLYFLANHFRRAFDRAYSLLGYENRKWLPAPCFRKVVNLKGIEEANINITGAGFFELYINGKKVGNDIQTPVYSQYEKAVYYHTYEISDYLVEGKNVFAVILGSGMFNVHIENSWSYDTCHWRFPPHFILRADFSGEEQTVLVSDDSWKVASGPILREDIYGGETYDANFELTGWHLPGFDDSALENAVFYPSPTKELRPMNMEPTRVIDEIQPINHWKAGDKRWIFDMGLSISGFARIRAKAPRGTEIVLSYGEKIKDNQLDRTNILKHTHKRDQKHIQRDIYICKGGETEIWQPRFTYHAFQYIEVTGLEEVKPDTVTGLVSHTDVATRGGFTSSDELQNRIFQAMNRANLNNYQGIPTDCPHREKNGWTGDVNLSIEYQLLTYESENILKKWLYDIVDGQKDNGQIAAIAPNPGWGYSWVDAGPAWDSSFIIIPWNIYLYRGDRELLERLYAPMKKYIYWQDSKTGKDLIRYGLGDHCPPSRKANRPKAPVDLTSTAYHYETYRLMGKIARALGNREDERLFGKRADELREAINREFIDQETGKVAGECQTSYAAVLYFDLVHEKLKPLVLNHLLKKVEECDNHLDTGILGTRYLLNVLCDYGHEDLAYEIASQKDYPGWGYWIGQGATTLWENWSGENSRNHRMFGSICSWHYNYLAGIKTDENSPGLKHIIIKPCFVEGLNHVEAKTESSYGEVIVKWERRADKIHLAIRIPDGSEATVYISKADRNRIVHDHSCRVKID